MQQQVVTPEEWQTARAELLEEEKAATKLLINLAAKRRQLPMVKVEKPDEIFFIGANGKQISLTDMFGRYKQLILYDFMFSEGDKEGCIGCSFVLDHIAHPGHLQSRDTTFAVVAPASIEKLTPYRERMGWKFPLYSRKHTFDGSDEKDPLSFAWRGDEEFFGIVVFMRQGQEVFHTYSTTMRGVENMLSTYALLDLTPLGRQEVGNGMLQFRHHDRYEQV